MALLLQPTGSVPAYEDRRSRGGREKNKFAPGAWCCDFRDGEFAWRQDWLTVAVMAQNQTSQWPRVCLLAIMVAGGLEGCSRKGSVERVAPTSAGSGSSIGPSPPVAPPPPIVDAAVATTADSAIAIDASAAGVMAADAAPALGGEREALMQRCKPTVSAQSGGKQRPPVTKEQTAACAELVRRYDGGRDFAIDDRTVYERGCNGGEKVACRKFGKTLLDELEEESFEAGRQLLDETCREKRDAIACLYLGNFVLDNDNNVATRIQRALSQYLEPGCELGVAEVCARVGYVYETLTAVKNIEKSLAAYRKACAAGDSAACARVTKLQAQP